MGKGVEKSGRRGWNSRDCKKGKEKLGKERKKWIAVKRRRREEVGMEKKKSDQEMTRGE